MDAFCFNYQHMDCPSILFKYRFGGKNFVKNGQLSDNVQKAVHFYHQIRGVDRKSRMAKKRLLRKNYRKQMLSSFHQTKLTKTSGSILADRAEQIKKTKFDIELIRIVDTFLDGHGNYSSNFKSFKLKSL